MYKTNMLTQINDEVEGRSYQLDGTTKKFKSVTTLINYAKPKEGLLKWRASVGEAKANKITQTAATRGTEVHKLIEDYYKSKKTSVTQTSDDVFFNKFLPVLDLITPIAVEEKTYWVDEATGRGFAGTYDMCGNVDTTKFIGRDSGVITSSNSVADWKNWNRAKYPVAQTKDGGKYYPLIGYYLQLSAYCAAINQRTNCIHEVSNAYIIGVTETCRSPFIYYLNDDAVMFYWDKMKNLVNCYYNNAKFDWEQMETEAERYGFLGERVDLVK